MWIKSVQPYLQAIQTLVTVGAVVIGAIWSRRTIFKKREEAPKIQLTHSVYSSVIDSDKRFVRVTLGIENEGSVLIRLDEVDTWLYQVKPWPDEILDEQKMLEVDRGDYKWPGISGVSNRIIKPHKVEIEPNESEDFHFDFVIDSTVEVFIAYSYVNNPTKSLGIGWNLSTIHDTDKKEVHGEEQVASRKRESGTGRRSGPTDRGSRKGHPK